MALVNALFDPFPIHEYGDIQQHPLESCKVSSFRLFIFQWLIKAMKEFGSSDVPLQYRTNLKFFIVFEDKFFRSLSLDMKGGYWSVNNLVRDTMESIHRETDDFFQLCNSLRMESLTHLSSKQVTSPTLIRQDAATHEPNTNPKPESDFSYEPELEFASPDVTMMLTPNTQPFQPKSILKRTHAQNPNAQILRVQQGNPTLTELLRHGAPGREILPAMTDPGALAG
jgi:hypothetical protein